MDVTKGRGRVRRYLSIGVWGIWVWVWIRVSGLIWSEMGRPFAIRLLINTEGFRIGQSALTEGLSATHSAGSLYFG